MLDDIAEGIEEPGENLAGVLDKASEAIGIFDSGVGGLTVLKQVADRMPRDDIIYLGDTARVPYGTKSPETVARYARACSRVLLERGIKMLVVACNTASCYALDLLQDELAIPVLGVVEPGARFAAAETRNGRVGVIGTAGTIRSGQYERAIAGIDADIEVFSKPCPLFVPLAEEGWTEGDVPFKAAEYYLREIREASVDTLVLGCTHYPLLKEVIGQVMGQDVRLVDSADATSATVREILDAMDMGASADNDDARCIRILVSDTPEYFEQVGRRFLGADLPYVEWVDF